MRYFYVLFFCFFLSACSETWEATGPNSPPGGTAILANGNLADGPEAVSSVTQVPDRGPNGPLPPFGTRGHSSAYEFASGYRVGSGDKLSIKVAGETDLTGEYPVDASGAISMPYVQTVTVAGLSTPQIEKILTDKLRAGYLREPHLSVQVSSLRPFFILGEVTTAGSYAYQAGMTVQNAIAIGGGYNTRADKSDVLITRRNAKGTATYKVPVTTQVFPGDIIYIRERWF
ncbi:MAG: polysaccharide export protein [Alphaproteobacteria bacterium]|nr:polysaccharide export protein [Alphaproteobacteria bacterium]